MKHHPRPPEQDDLLRPRLIDLTDLRHELVALAALIDWEFFEREWAGFFPSSTSRPGASPRVAAGGGRVSSRPRRAARQRRRGWWQGCSIFSMPSGFRMRRWSRGGWRTP